MNTVQIRRSNFETTRSSLCRESLRMLEEKKLEIPFSCSKKRNFAGVGIIFDFISQNSKRSQLIFYHFLLNVPTSVTLTVTSMTQAELEEEYLSIFCDYQHFIESYSTDTIISKIDAFCRFAQHVVQETDDKKLIWRYSETLASIRILRLLTKNILARE